MLHRGEDGRSSPIVQGFEGRVPYLEPPMLLGHAARSHEDVQMQVPIAGATRGLQDHHIARLQRAPLEPRQRIAKHLDPSLHQISQ